MSFSIEQFKAEATKHGFIRPSFFLVAIPKPPAWYGKKTQFLTYLCSGAALPGSQILTSDERQIGYGKTRKIPYDVAHTDINLTFYSDGNAEVLEFFENWMRNIVAYGEDDVNVKGAMHGELHYPDHYETNIEIFQYNENPGTNNIEIIKYTLGRAFPISVGEQQLSWEQGDVISTINVGFTFRDYWIQKNIAGKLGSNTPMTRDTLGNKKFQVEGFLAQWQERKNRADNAEGILAGFIGMEALTAPLGVISKYSSMINDKLNVVNNIGSNVNSILGTYGSLLGSKTPSIPSIPNIQFP